jgi:hypothetical protein
VSFLVPWINVSFGSSSALSQASLKSSQFQGVGIYHAVFMLPNMTSSLEMARMALLIHSDVARLVSVARPLSAIGSRRKAHSAFSDMQNSGLHFPRVFDQSEYCGVNVPMVNQTLVTIGDLGLIG